MQNAQIADALDELAALYELDGAVRYRVLAYRDAAKVVRDWPSSVAELARADRATELAGIGDTLQAKIKALVEGGQIPAAAKLKQKFPASLVEVTRIPGLGSKTARRLFDELGVSSLDELEIAARAGRIRELKGLGAKAEENILIELARVATEGHAERRLLSEVLPLATELRDALADLSAASEVEIAGSARRGAETCKDIDLIATGEDPGALVEALTAHDLIASGSASGSGGARATTHNGIKVDLRIVPEAEFGNLLQHFTGSMEHNVALRERAQKMGLSVSEHGIAEIEGGEVERCADEQAVYARLGLEWIDPALRQGRGEIAAAESESLPELVATTDIKGDLHCHTTLSDGRNTLEEMVDAAIGLGYEYLAITDHSASHGFGNDVQPRALERRIDEIAALNQRFDEITVLAGSEVNVLPSGELDYEDELLGRLDWVIASVHTSFRMDKATMTGRIIAAIEHPEVDCIGHLTGRLLLRRGGYEVDIEAIASAAAAAETMLEINANPRRRDLSEHHARVVAEAGIPIAISTDAHGVDTLAANMAYGIATARRAWLAPEQIANTRSWEELRALSGRSAD